MSLESQVVALVSAANSLTSQVAGKLAEIDEKTNAVANSITSAIKDSNSVTVFIDQQDGSDANDGLSIDQPLKTIRESRKVMMPGGAYRLNFIGNYVLDGHAELSPPTNSSIWFDGGHSGKPTKLTVGYGGGQTGSLATLGSLDLSYCANFYMRNMAIGLDMVSVSELLSQDSSDVTSRLRFLKSNLGTSTNVLIGIRFELVDFSDYLQNAKALVDQYGSAREVHFIEGVANLLITMFRNCTFPADMTVAADRFYADRTAADYSGKLSVSNLSSIFRG